MGSERREKFTIEWLEAWCPVSPPCRHIDCAWCGFAERFRRIAAAAYARGAREMRERCAQVVADTDVVTVILYHVYDDGAATLGAAERAIRALPDTPEGEAGEETGESQQSGQSGEE